MAIEVHVWEITGMTALMLNNPAETMGGSDDGLKTKKKVYDDKVEAEIRTYRDEKKQFIYTTAGFRAGLLCAASGRKIGKSTAKQVIAGAVFPAETDFLILGADGKPAKLYEIDKRRVIVNKKGILRCRPKWAQWKCKLPLEVDTDFFQTKNGATDVSIVTELLNIAGRVFGIGELRPDTSKGKSGVGNFGRYSAKLTK